MSETVRVLVIDDDRFLCKLLKDYLHPHGFEVSYAHNGEVGISRALSGEVDVVLLDVMLPGIDGFEVLRRIRTMSKIPILMLTAKGEEDDRISGLNRGADDYIPKTFSHRELLARLQALMRRCRSEQVEEMLVEGDLSIDIAHRFAYIKEAKVDLTRVEFDILLTLARANGRVLSREQLLREASARGPEVSDRSVDVHISSLRRKLGEDSRTGRYIETVRNYGYRFLQGGRSKDEQ